ncbi:MAG: CsiV family protein [Alcanivoracaceae bacterium]
MRIALTALLLGLATFASTALANPYSGMSIPELRRTIAEQPKVLEESWYQVEVLVFARKNPASNEFWRLDRQPDLNRSALIRLDRDEPELPEHVDDIDRHARGLGAWRVLDGSTLPLKDMAERLDKAGDRILLHRSWRQPIRERARAFPVLVEGGNPLPVTALDMDAPEPSPLTGIDGSGAFSTLPALVELKEDSDYLQRELQGALRLHLSRFLHVEPNLWFNTTSADGQRFWVRIDQSRRMRSEELHYLDHPLFGLLVRVTPWKHPEQKKLDDMKAALRSREGR